MKVLVLNTGSSSVKYRVFECENGEATDLAHGLVERIGSEEEADIKCECCLEHKPRCAARMIGEPGKLSIPDHRAAINDICDILLSANCGIVSDISEIEGIGHRVVHGGEEFSGSILIDGEVIEGIERVSKLAPLHNPPALQGIRACADVFDTAFHSRIPRVAYRYPLPEALYTEHGLRKYGFHGTSHRFVSAAAMKMLDKPAEDTRIITCHLGNGSSISAVKGGKCVETSMGLTPLGGVMMGTRPGDLDPYLPLFMQKELGMSVDEVDKTLNKESGLLGVCGLNDMRDIEQRAGDGDEKCELALHMFAYRIASFIGSYAMVMGGVDAIVFTAGIGENGAAMRARILRNAGYLGCHLDEARNARGDAVISTPGSTCQALVIPTNEELVIAVDTARIVSETASRQAAVAD
jgi:acetate kinase